MGSLTFDAEKRLFLLSWIKLKHTAAIRRKATQCNFLFAKSFFDTFQTPSCLKFTSAGLSNFKLNYSFPTEFFAWQSSQIKQNKNKVLNSQNILWERRLNDSIFLSAAAKIHLSKTEWQSCLHFVRYWQHSLSNLYTNEKNAQWWSGCSEKKKADILVKCLYSKYLIRVEWAVIPLAYQWEILNLMTGQYDIMSTARARGSF